MSRRGICVEYFMLSLSESLVGHSVLDFAVALGFVFSIVSYDVWIITDIRIFLFSIYIFS